MRMHGSITTASKKAQAAQASAAASQYIASRPALKKATGATVLPGEAAGVDPGIPGIPVSPNPAVGHTPRPGSTASQPGPTPQQQQPAAGVQTHAAGELAQSAAAALVAAATPESEPPLSEVTFIAGRKVQ